MALSRNSVPSRMFRDSVRIGLIAASLLANLAAGVHTVAPVAAAVATPSAAQSDANLGLAAPNLVGIDPATCLGADWMPQSNTTLIVPRGTITMNFVVTVTSATALDATTAQYTFYAPGNSNIPIDPSSLCSAAPGCSTASIRTRPRR